MKNALNELKHKLSIIKTTRMRSQKIKDSVTIPQVTERRQGSTIAGSFEKSCFSFKIRGDNSLSVAFHCKQANIIILFTYN